MHESGFRALVLLKHRHLLTATTSSALIAQIQQTHSEYLDARQLELSPADEVSRGAIAERSIPDEADASIEEGGRGDAKACGPLHVAILPRRLQCVLHMRTRP